MNRFEHNLFASALVLALGLVIMGALAANAFYGVHALNNTLSVTGSATATTTADGANWTVTVNRTAYANDLVSAQGRVASDAQSVAAFFAKSGITGDAVQTSPVFVDRDYSGNTNAPVSYNVHEDVSVSSDDTALIDKLSKDIGSLTARGILVSVQPPQYYVKKLPEIRVSLIGQAVKDAKARAAEIAKSTGQSVGPLQSASTGVVQVMSPNSVDVSDYGSYDTSTIDKQVMVTVRAVFLVK